MSSTTRSAFGLLALALTLVPGCGSAEADNDAADPDGGSSGGASAGAGGSGGVDSGTAGKGGSAGKHSSGGVGGSDGSAGGPLECGPGKPCKVQGTTCQTKTERCYCEVGSGLAWQCDDLACPPKGSLSGPCTQDGLRCGAGFENSGKACISGQWIQCLQPRSTPWCPPINPGDACCVDPSFGPPDTCPGPDGLYRCVGSKWTKQ